MINVDHVVGVLLADGWHRVDQDTFLLNEFQFEQDGGPALSPASTLRYGFMFEESDILGGVLVCAGPLASILAVRVRDH